MDGYVFISYSRADQSYVERLTSFLRTAGLSVWYDRSLVAGEAWSRTVKRAIERCSVCVVVMTPTSEESQWVDREINWAERLRKPVVPLLFDGEVFFRLSDLHYGDVRRGLMPSPTLVARLIELSQSGPRSAITASRKVGASSSVGDSSQPDDLQSAASIVTLGVLYVMVCGSPIARDVGVLVDLAQAAGWEVCVVTTPDGRKYVDVEALQSQTGHQVRCYRSHPDDENLLPPADAMILAPATANTLNKWAAGISDTLVLSLLIEAYGFGLPVAVVPYENRVVALHPRFEGAISQLREWGVTVLHGDDVVIFGGPGQEDRFRRFFPWQKALLAVSPRD